MIRSLKKNPFVAKNIKKNYKTKKKSRKRNNCNLVSCIYHYTYNDRPYDCRSKWQRAFAYIYNRSYGRSQIGRICTYFKFSRTCKK
uniref:Ribosomal protein S19 n=1 Tax=Pycnostachys reticulata TaxID=204195 RepID=A0A8K1QU93_9LAMI|nr:ribosomal protein S19 [Pycnostachys reticulata]